MAGTVVESVQAAAFWHGWAKVQSLLASRPSVAVQPSALALSAHEPTALAFTFVQVASQVPAAESRNRQLSWVATGRGGCTQGRTRVQSREA